MVTVNVILSLTVVGVMLSLIRLGTVGFRLVLSLGAALN